MLIYLGIISGENMQIEGFWYYLLIGTFEAATIHYAVAKIFGPLIFGRGWCGYACWTAMVLDFLPYKAPETPRKKIGWIRYITFAVSLIFVSMLLLAHAGNMERIMFWAFIIGNVSYYAVGVILAFSFKDNRAFCKYICPVTVFLKPMSYFSLFRIECDKSKCVSCGRCKKVCPMEVDVTDNSGGEKTVQNVSCVLSALKIVQRMRCNVPPTVRLLIFDCAAEIVSTRDNSNPLPAEATKNIFYFPKGLTYCISVL